MLFTRIQSNKRRFGTLPTAVFTISSARLAISLASWQLYVVVHDAPLKCEAVLQRRGGRSLEGRPNLTLTALCLAMQAAASRNPA